MYRVYLLLIIGSVTLCIPKIANAQSDESTGYKIISGQVKSAETGKPVIFANVFLNNTSLGTVSNSDGEFILRIPDSYSASELSVSFLGYKNKVIPLLDNLTDLKIKLEPYTISIDEIIIKSMPLDEILQMAMANIRKNYSLESEMQKAFYRETIKKNRNYVSIVEAVLDIYKSGYGTNFDQDRLRIYKGRKSSNVEDMDTLLVKLQGGPKTSLMLDIVKTRGEIIDVDMFDYYDYKFAGMTSINDRSSYVISFDQKDYVLDPLFKGNIYIDSENFAITGFDFAFSPKQIDKVATILVKKKPRTLDLDFESGNYLVKYRVLNDKWYLNYVRCELVFKAKWDKMFFKKTFTTMFEMAVTDSKKENVEKFPFKESAKTTDFLVDDINQFRDDDFWGDYNVIKPDESIEVAIKKLGKKLKSN